jgi:hypothetical protein
VTHEQRIAEHYAESTECVARSRLRQAKPFGRTSNMALDEQLLKHDQQIQVSGAMIDFLHRVEEYHEFDQSSYGSYVARVDRKVLAGSDYVRLIGVAFARRSHNRWRKAMPKISGGCLCGAVRYECNAEPLGTAICHCTHCQSVSGSAFSVNVVVPAPRLTWQGQSLASYADKGESGKPLSRKFCRNCGSSLATETEALPGAIIIKAGTLDDKSWLKPNYHLWTNSAQPWVRIEPGATTFSKGRT